MSLHPPSAPPASDEAQVARVRLWTLPLFFFGWVLIWWLLERNRILPQQPYGSVWIPVFIWWLRDAAPRPFSLRAVMGQPPKRSDYGWIGLLLVGCLCARFVWWSVKFLRTGQPPNALAFNFPSHPTLVASLVATLVAPVMEELLFRRTLFRKWRLRIGSRKALLLTSILFGLPHWGELIPSTLMGVTFVLLYTSTRSLWSPMLFHIINNAMSLPLAYASPIHIALETWWKQASYVLVLLLGSGAWLWFMLRSLRTLGDPLPPDSPLLQAAITPPSAPTAHSARS